MGANCCAPAGEELEPSPISQLSSIGERSPAYSSSASNAFDEEVEESPHRVSKTRCGFLSRCRNKQVDSEDEMAGVGPIEKEQPADAKRRQARGETYAFEQDLPVVRHQTYNYLVATPSASSYTQGGRDRLQSSASQRDQGVAQELVSAFGPVNLSFRAALANEDTTGQVFELVKSHTIDGFEAFALVLDELGGNSSQGGGSGGSMGSYIITNTKKLRTSKAKSASDGYREWLFSELDVHKATGSANYVDPSGWMANVWIAWTLEFFVEMFALIHCGQDTSQSVNSAYNKTLKNHHNWLQSVAFGQATKKLPNRQVMYKTLCGRSGATTDDVHRELGEFVAMGRKIYTFCIILNTQLENALKEAVKKK